MTLRVSHLSDARQVSTAVNAALNRTEKLVQQPAIANDASGAANQATVNAILAALRTVGIIAP
jgi:hypothetical protein